MDYDRWGDAGERRCVLRSLLANPAPLFERRGSTMAELDGSELEFYDGMIAKMIEDGQTGKNIALKQEDISRILLKAKEIFLSQPSMLELASPIKILGDIHGCVRPSWCPRARRS
jgi:serine/threonine-protein phosphatase PP1 catalytic subunit